MNHLARINMPNGGSTAVSNEEIGSITSWHVDLGNPRVHFAVNYSSIGIVPRLYALGDAVTG